MSKQIKGERLFWDGCDVTALAEKYGTPLYIYSKTMMRERILELKEAFTDCYPNTRIAYAAKAFLPVKMAAFVLEEGLCLDVVSGGELVTALKAGFPPEKIEFNGNNKLPEEIEMAVREGVGRIIIDGSRELDWIAQMAKKYARKVSVLYRITPDVAADSHDYIVTGKKDSKFGFHLGEDGIIDEVQRALSCQEVDLLGFHFHLGSQLFEPEVYLQGVDKLTDLLFALRERYDFVSRELNIGGGFGIAYTSADKRVPYREFFEPIMQRLDQFFEEQGLKRPCIVTEPGRSLVGEAGITLYRVGAIKEIPGLRKYVAVDGGMTDNIRPALYQAKYEAVVANKAGQVSFEKVTICGKCCESGDIIAKDILLARPEEGDIVAVFSTGAYGYSMASNYNRLPVPAVVFLEKGQSEVVVRRQTYEDVLRQDVFH